MISGLSPARSSSSRQSAASRRSRRRTRRLDVDAPDVFLCSPSTYAMRFPSAGRMVGTALSSFHSSYPGVALLGDHLSFLRCFLVTNLFITAKCNWILPPPETYLLPSSHGVL